jgi:hypothetical protein
LLQPVGIVLRPNSARIPWPTVTHYPFPINQS